MRMGTNSRIPTPVNKKRPLERGGEEQGMICDHTDEAAVRRLARLINIGRGRRRGTCPDHC